YRFRHEMQLLHATNHFTEQARSVRRDDRWICGVRRSWRGRLDSDNFGAFRDAFEKGGTADQRGGSRKKLATSKHGFLLVVFCFFERKACLNRSAAEPAADSSF